MSSDHCTVCGSFSTVEWYPATADPANLSFQYMKSPDVRRTFRVVRCRTCSHVFCSPLPQDLFARYQDVVDDEYLRQAEARRLTARACLALIRRHSPGGTLLDVGCATGDFVDEAMAAGYQAEGLELSRWACAHARGRGLMVHEERLEALARRRPGAYDIVTLWGVIEHFEKPHDEIRHIATVLKPGGILVVWTGDVDSITSRLLGRLWWYWLGQHIQYFTAKSLARLCADAGLRHEADYLYPFVVSEAVLKTALGRHRFGGALAAALKPVLAVRPVWCLRIPGEMFYVGRRLSA